VCRKLFQRKVPAINLAGALISYGFCCRPSDLGSASHCFQHRDQHALRHQPFECFRKPLQALRRQRVDTFVKGFFGAVEILDVPGKDRDVVECRA